MVQNNCLDCNLLTCMKLHKGDDLEGGELYILKEIINQKKIFFCQLEIPLQSCCNLIGTILENDGEMDPFLTLAAQCLYDLRTSAFLAITAHYRGAKQLIRPAIEALLVGIYFKARMEQARPKEVDGLSNAVLDDFSEISPQAIVFWQCSVPNPNGFQQANFIDLLKAANDYNDWIEDSFKISPQTYHEITGIPVTGEMRLDFRFIKGWLVKNKAISGRDNQRLELLEGLLNKHIHSYFKYMDIGNQKCSNCPAFCRYDNDQYLQWLDMFQNILEIIIRKLLREYFEEVDDKDVASIDVTDNIVSIFVNLTGLENAEREFDLRLIKSNDLRKFISEMQKKLRDFKTHEGQSGCV